MKITIADKKLKAALEDEAVCRRRYGAELAKKIGVRVAVLTAAQSLADFWPPMSRPERCHELQADLAGVFSIDLKQPYRLLFKPANASPRTPAEDEKARWQAIDAVAIIDIQDTHG